MPDAKLKIYLDASPDERATRRYHELIQRGQQPNYDSVLTNIQSRDKIDSGREVAPLQAADDALVLDTTDLSIDKVLDMIQGLVYDKGRLERL